MARMLSRDEREGEELMQEALNPYKKTAGTKAESPSETINVAAVVCAESFSRLDNNHGTRVVFVDVYMKPRLKGYVKSDRRYERVLKRTVWGPNHRSAGRPRHPNAVGATKPGLVDEFPTYKAAKRSRRTGVVHDEYAGDRAESRAEDNEEENVLM
ncbi:hypothetical protein GQ600_5307 [Phytophthora cactorum]|nr:hypothetical protein GQ600_5307 [Phytophthora cactorum]